MNRDRRSTAALRSDSPSLVSEKALGKRRESSRASGESKAEDGNPKRRVLPYRARRIGTGAVGSNSIDERILEHRQQLANEGALVPPGTVFVLTTSEKNLPPLQDEGRPASLVEPNGDVPGSTVAASTSAGPDFVRLSEIEMIGSRLRVRANPEESEDTSDEAYISRHTRYEKFEKKHRRREVERLEQEHLKLRERIVELRAKDPEEFGGEEQKKAWLDDAEALEKTYTRLLRKSNEAEKEKEKAMEKEGVGGIGSEARAGRRMSEPPSTTGTPMPSLKLKLKFPPNSATQSARSTPQPAIHHSHSQPFRPSLLSQSTSSLPARLGSSSPSRSQVRDPHTGRFMSSSVAPFSQSTSSKPATPRPPQVPILLQAALRPSRSDRNMRRPSAFGAPLGPYVEETRDFEIPSWLGIDLEGDYDGGDDLGNESEGL